jgi:hypothetical protein
MKNEQLNLNTPRNWMKYLLLWGMGVSSVTKNIEFWLLNQKDVICKVLVCALIFNKIVSFHD